MPAYAKADGSARGRKGEEIPIYGRVVALCDVYDALSSARVYKKAWKEEDVLETIAKESGAHFDPALTEILFASLDVLRSIQQRYADDAPVQ
jgi:HD-GYP domain-containing protein (c-di-GMP phosphodiesterase class II)